MRHKQCRHVRHEPYVGHEPLHSAWHGFKHGESAHGAAATLAVLFGSLPAKKRILRLLFRITSRRAVLHTKGRSVKAHVPCNIHPRAFVSSLCMAPLDDQTWRTLDSPTRWCWESASPNSGGR